MSRLTLSPDEVFVTRQGERQYLGFAIDQDGDVIDLLVQRRLTAPTSGGTLFPPVAQRPNSERVGDKWRGQMHSQGPKQVLGVAPLQAICVE